MSGNDLIAIIPPGRYFVGDPGRVMRIGLFQNALEAADGQRNARVDVEDRAVVLAGAKPAIYPDSGLLNQSRYECESGKLGLVHVDLLIDSDIVAMKGSIVTVTGIGAVSVIDNMIVLRDECHSNLVCIDMIGNRGRIACEQVDEENHAMAA